MRKEVCCDASCKISRVSIFCAPSWDTWGHGCLGKIHPIQNPRGSSGDEGQYVYWMTMPHPKPETVTAHWLKVPEEFTRPDFIDLGVEVHTACGAPFTGAWRCSFIELLAFEGRGSTAALFFGWCSKTCQLPAQSESQAALG